MNNFKYSQCRGIRFKVPFEAIIKDFLSRYPLIQQKFKINKAYVPQPQFDSINKTKNSIIFKSSSNSLPDDSVGNKKFYGLIFEELESQNDKGKHYNALFYQGQLNQFDVKQGKGWAVLDNGDVYEGTWEKNVVQGFGKYTQCQNKLTYEGQFKQWKKQGKGKLVSNVSQKFKYEGEFKNDQIDGQGCIEFEDGSKYKGSYRNGLQEGFGVHQTNSMKYEGTWKKGLMSGAGTAVWYSQKGEIVSKYTGQYKQGKKHGFGQYQVKNGKMLRGQWFEGKFNPGVNSYVTE